MKLSKILLLLAVLFHTNNLVSQDLSEVYEKVSPAVVAIFTEENVTLPTSDRNLSTVTKSGLGSGFLISENLVVTAAHVVTVTDKINVRFADGETITGRVAMAYSESDIALVELLKPKTNATTVNFGDSDKLKIGNQVFVIGVPLGVGFSMSSGYVSGFKNRSKGENPFTISEFIQTDAAINQGNSGGPMFNLDGEVVGVVSHIKTKSGGSDGIGYATTSNLTKKLLLDIQIPWFGAELFSLHGDLAKLFNLPQSAGLLVQKVAPSTIFSQMRVQEGNVEAQIGNQKLIMGGDIILAFNDINYEFNDDTFRSIASFAKKLGDKPEFEITVLREGQIIKLRYP